MTVLTQNSSIIHTLSSGPVHHFFHNFEVSLGTLNRSLNNYGFIGNAVFFTCMHVHKALSNEM